MRFTHIDINFDITYEGHQNWSKYFLWTFWELSVTIICDTKIDVNKCEHIIFTQTYLSPIVKNAIINFFFNMRNQIENCSFQLFNFFNLKMSVEKTFL